MTAPTLRIERFSPGPYQTNCYLLSAEGAQGCWIIDAGFEPGAMLRRAAELGGVKAIILTHTHIDHIAGVHAAKQAFPDAPLCVHAAEAGWLQDPRLNLSAFSGKPTTTRPRTARWRRATRSRYTATSFPCCTRPATHRGASRCTAPVRRW